MVGRQTPDLPGAVPLSMGTQGFPLVQQFGYRPYTTGRQGRAPFLVGQAEKGVPRPFPCLPASEEIIPPSPASQYARGLRDALAATGITVEAVVGWADEMRVGLIGTTRRV